MSKRQQAVLPARRRRRPLLANRVERRRVERMSERAMTVMSRFTKSLLALVLVLAAGVFAQTQTTTDTTTAAPPADTSGTSVQQALEEILEEPTGADAYRYDPQ